MSVLICSSEPSIYGFILANLKSKGYTTVLAPTGKEALSYLSSSENSIGAVILDCDVSDFDEFELISRLRQVLPAGVPIVFLLTSDVESDEIRALGNGANKVFHKPFGPKDLMAFFAEAHPPFRLS